MLYLSLGFQVDTLHKRRFVHILQVLSSYKKIFVGTLVILTHKKNPYYPYFAVNDRAKLLGFTPEHYLW
jgi:hypothetical protein